MLFQDENGEVAMRLKLEGVVVVLRDMKAWNQGQDSRWAYWPGGHMNVGMYYPGDVDDVGVVRQVGTILIAPMSDRQVD